eukprot:GSChrysophyteH1.ASY1.ANO1.2828.1 assembled CDS
MFSFSHELEREKMQVLTALSRDFSSKEKLLISMITSRAVSRVARPCLSRFGPRIAPRCYSSCPVAYDLVVEKVPVLGESITEGSISSWTKAVGERVEVDDCVVIIETDKVSVDIKSTVAGVLSRQIGGDGDVAVGDDLFEIDTEGEASLTAAAPAAPAVAATPAAPAPAAQAPPSTATHGRTPLIKFLGKRSLIKAAPTPVAAGGAWFGRPQLSEREMAAIESGGASEV